MYSDKNSVPVTNIDNFFINTPKTLRSFEAIKTRLN